VSVSSERALTRCFDCTSGCTLDYNIAVVAVAVAVAVAVSVAVAVAVAGAVAVAAAGPDSDKVGLRYGMHNPGQVCSFDIADLEARRCCCA